MQKVGREKRSAASRSFSFASLPSPWCHLDNMGSRDWLKTIIGRRKTKQDPSKQAKGNSNKRSNTFKWRNQSDNKVSNAFSNGISSRSPADSGLTVEGIAARRIQTAFRGFKARRTLRRLKGLKRLQDLSQGCSIKKQASMTLSYVQSWNKIQAEIRARRVCMVAEGHIKQKKQENQVKLEAKLHDIEVDWCGGSETLEEIHSRIQQREEAAVKRERAMAYAFSHQWRASSGHGQLSYEIEKGSWGWSWVERWIAARPWEARLAIVPLSPKKVQTKPTNRAKEEANTNTSTRMSTQVKNGSKKSAKGVSPKVLLGKPPKTSGITY